jgi:hypothetical protein
MYAKVENTCDWTETFYTQAVIVAHLMTPPEGSVSDIKEVWL